ncbi:hypothetical protein WJX73_010553 [Symbiochloris irregularis]|uniref:Uncharacterized protein n=1 Tax=Symbiochloris irregularis TaxID=706552 RepID=A0AAW1NVL6_9CHLO
MGQEDTHSRRSLLQTPCCNSFGNAPPPPNLATNQAQSFSTSKTGQSLLIAAVVVVTVLFALAILAYKYGARCLWHNSFGALGRYGSSAASQMSGMMHGQSQARGGSGPSGALYTGVPVAPTTAEPASKITAKSAAEEAPGAKGEGIMAAAQASPAPEGDYVGQPLPGKKPPSLTSLPPEMPALGPRDTPPSQVLLPPEAYGPRQATTRPPTVILPEGAAAGGSRAPPSEAFHGLLASYINTLMAAPPGMPASRPAEQNDAGLQSQGIHSSAPAISTG